MNQTQRKYVLERLKKIYNKKKKTLEEECANPVPPTTHRELQEMIKSGVIRVKRPEKPLSRYDDIYDVFNVPVGWDEDRKTKDFDDRLNDLDYEYEDISDKIILIVDGAAARNLIKSFEEFGF